MEPSPEAIEVLKNSRIYATSIEQLVTYTDTPYICFICRGIHNNMFLFRFRDLSSHLTTIGLCTEIDACDYRRALL